MDKEIQQARSHMEYLISKLIQKQFDKAAMKWIKRFPKRKLRLITGNGVAFFDIDGYIFRVNENGLSCDWNGFDHIGISDFTHKKNEIFSELMKVSLWLYDNLENHEFESNYLENREYN